MRGYYNLLLGKAAAVALLVVLPFFEHAAAQTVSDSENRFSMEVPSGWAVVDPSEAEETVLALGNPKLRLIGIDLEDTDIILMNTDGAVDAIPHIQVSVFPYPGLGLTDGDLQEVESTIESIYRDRIGVRYFKLFKISRVTQGGLQALEITGVYPHGESNVKILQHLIPGSGHLYAVTYSAREREFSNHLEQVREVLNTVKISDAPLFTIDFSGLLHWITLLFIVAVVIWLILYVSGNRFGREPPLGDGPSVSPFLRKK